MRVVDELLLIAHCDSCRRWLHPPVRTCPDCGGPLTSEPVSGRGTVFTYTINVQPFNPAVPTPYVIAIVELNEPRGVRLAVNIVDCEPDSVFCGMPVQVRPVGRADADPHKPGAGSATSRLLAVPSPT